MKKMRNIVILVVVGLVAFAGYQIVFSSRSNQPATEPIPSKIEKRSKQVSVPQPHAPERRAEPTPSVMPQRYGGAPLSDQDTENLIAQAYQLSRSQKLDEAIALLEKAWKADMANEAIAIEYAHLVWSKEQNTAKAEAILLEALSQNPESENVSAMLGDIYNTNKEWKKAEPYLRKAAASEQARPETQTDLGRNLMFQGKPDEAYPFFENAHQTILKEIEAADEPIHPQLIHIAGKTAGDICIAAVERGDFEAANRARNEARKYLPEGHSFLKALDKAIQTGKAMQTPKRTAE